LSTAYTYVRDFRRDPSFSVDGKDHGAPFFAGAGFFGAKILQAPAGGNAVQMYGNTVNGNGGVNDARDVFQLYRFLSGTSSPAAGDQPCNNGPPALDLHLCWIKYDSPADIRDFISVSGGALAPGEFKTLVVAYLFAAPYGGCPASCSVPPGDPLRWVDPVALAVGANQVDSIAGYRGYADLNGDGAVQGGEVRAAPRSLFGKAQMAQAIFDSRFLLPQAPAAPEFFVVPGDNRVTVLWKPSATEVTGDPYFAGASTVTRIDPAGNLVINPLYDPNYRQFDVEGYRIYRSRTPDFRDAEQVAQFDYAGTSISDYTGRINPRVDCAPELGIRLGCPTLDSLVPGHPLEGSLSWPLVSRIVQVRDGDRMRGTEPIAFVLQADTLGDYEGKQCLCDTGVPFQFVDNTVRNGLTYFYAVTAFDVNSLQSAPSSQESAPSSMRRARPAKPAANVVSEGEVTVTFEGRGRVLDPALPVPSLDPATGRFSGPFPPANGWGLSLLEPVKQLYSGEQEARVRLDSISLGQTAIVQPGIPIQFHFTVTADGQPQYLSIPIQQSSAGDFGGTSSVISPVSLFQSDSALSAMYGGRPVPLHGTIQMHLPPSSSMGDWGRGMSGFNEVTYNGIRWFDGPSPQHNETMVDPNGTNCPGGCFIALGDAAVFNNAGSLTGVTTVYQPLAYIMMTSHWRNVAESQAGARRSADYNVHWGPGGMIDSVVDVTHNVLVPFSPTAGGTWGILNTSAQGAGGHDNRPTVLTPTDWTCVEPFRSVLTQPTTNFLPCTSPAPFGLTRQAELGAIAFAAGEQQSTTNPGSVRNPANLSTQPGFALYLAGTITEFGMTTLPQAGTVWAMRDYVGVIRNGKAMGPYSFQPPYQGRPLTAVGVEIVVRSSATNTVLAASNRDLRSVHTVPDPFYYESDLAEGRGVRFVNLPARATIRIYSASGILLRVLDHQPASQQGDTYWDLRTRNGQRAASGVYFYHVEAGDARRVGRMTIVNYTN
jgi:hypothetical protein